MTSGAAATLQAALRRRGETVGCAESLTGGQLAAVLTSAPGASETFVGGVVSYASRVKRDLLGVAAERVVSAECAVEMAVGARSLLGVDWALSTTGVAGPDRQEGQDVGTVYVGVAGARGAHARKLMLDGDRAAIRNAACMAAVDLLLVEVTDG